MCRAYKFFDTYIFAYEATFFIEQLHRIFVYKMRYLAHRKKALYSGLFQLLMLRSKALCAMTHIQHMHKFIHIIYI